jgi:hypothetical protein
MSLVSSQDHIGRTPKYFVPKGEVMGKKEKSWPNDLHGSSRVKNNHWNLREIYTLQSP